MTCPACGLANEPGARVCRNCGLPIASATDPLRGVVPGRVDMPSTQRSGLSATIGLVLVVGLLLVGGTLAVSGGGILSSGGRLVAEAGASPSTAPASVEQGAVTPVIDDSEEPSAEETGEADKIGTSLDDYTCESAAIRDLSRGRWFLSEVAAGARSEEGGRYDQVYWTMTRQGSKKAKNGTTVTMEWTSPKDAQQRFGIERVPGTRAIVITFDGPVDISAGSLIEDLALEGAGIEQVRKIQMFEDNEGTVRTVIGLRGESCARMEARNWGAKSKTRNARVNLDIEYFGAAE